MMKMNLWRTLMSASLCALMACTFTACDDDDDEEETGTDQLNDEKWDISGMKVEGTKDGKIVFSGSVKSTKKLTKFTAKDKDGNETPLFNKDDKNIKIDDIDVKEGDINWKYQTPISGEIDMAKGPYTLTCDLRFTKSVDITLGTKFEWVLGTSASKNASYGSFKDGKSYTQPDAEANPEKIEVILQGTSTTKDVKLASASEAKSQKVKDGCAKAIIKGDGTTGTIVTSDGCCASYTIALKEGEDYTVSGLRYGTETGITIDTSAAFAADAPAAAAE